MKGRDFYLFLDFLGDGGGSCCVGYALAFFVLHVDCLGGFGFEV